jgi:NADPH:quinone reductase-like Zn-dependent oxidoreductase
MKAAVIKQFGKTNVFEIIDNYPEPMLQPNQVMIKVHSTSINPLDLNIRKGLLKLFLGSKFPMILGNDVAGKIIQCGKDITNFQVGDEVYCMSDSNKKMSFWGFSKPGTYATFVVTREDTLSLKPKNLTFEESAVIPLCSLTAYQALVEIANIKDGDKILINGASGGVGVFAVQIAKSYGAHITCVCSSKNIRKLTELNVDKILDYTKTDILKIKDQFDIIYDVASNHKYNNIKHLLKKSGIYISNIAPIIVFLFPFLRKIRKIHRFAFTWVVPSGENLKKITEKIERNEIKPIVDKIFPLEEIDLAHNYCENGKPFGKISITI